MIRTFQEFLNRATKEEYQKLYDSRKDEYHFKTRMSKEGWALSQEDFDSMTVLDILALRADIKRLLPTNLDHYMNYYYNPDDLDFFEDLRFKLYRFDNYIFTFEANRILSESWKETDIFAQSVKKIYCQRMIIMQSYEDFVNIMKYDTDERITMYDAVKRMTYQDRLSFINDLESKSSKASFKVNGFYGKEKWYQLGDDVITVETCSLDESVENLARHLYNVRKYANKTFDDM